jgi:hypothetical protein
MTSYKIDESLGSAITKFSKTHTPDLNLSGKDHLIVTEICNPLEGYLKRKYPDIIPYSQETQKIMNIGNNIHKSCEKWVQKMGAIVSSESYLDGVYQGFKITGKIDAKLDNRAIIDFKTKQILPESISDVIKKYPQDVEQLISYLVLDGSEIKTGFLFFISRGDPSIINSFKIEINNFDKAIEFLKKREKLCRSVYFGNQDPSLLGKCRYCFNYDECNYHKEGVCKWKDNEALSDDFSDFISIERDLIEGNKFSTIIKENRKVSGLFSLYNLLVPRKCLIESCVDNLPYNPFPPNIEKSYAQKTVNLFNKNLLKDGKETMELHGFEDIYPYKNNWFNKLSSHTKKPSSIPFLSHAVTHDNQDINLTPSIYKIAELGILVAINKKTTGLLIQYYPNHGNMFKVFEIKYSFDSSVTENLKETLDALKSSDIKRLNDLPKCVFSCNECPYSDFC